MRGFDIFWIVFLVFSIVPLYRRARVERARFVTLRRIEISREARLITLIHRQEAISVLGIPLSRYINIDDSEQVLRAIRMTPDDLPINMVLHTPGGLVLAAEQIAYALMKHPAKVTVFVPHYAMSGGTMIALAADEIVMDGNAVLGPVDPQIGQYPAASILKAVAQKDANEVDDQTLILADIAQKAVRQVQEFVCLLLRDRLGDNRATELCTMLTDGRWTHDYPILFDSLKAMGLPVSTELPDSIHTLMELYPQPEQRRPSVQFIPVPYTRPDTNRKRN